MEASTTFIILSAIALIWLIARKPVDLGKASAKALKRQHVQIYFPIVACLIISIILSLLLTFLLNM